MYLQSGKLPPPITALHGGQNTSKGLGGMAGPTAVVNPAAGSSTVVVDMTQTLGIQYGAKKKLSENKTDAGLVQATQV